MSAEVEKFLGAGTTLSNRDNLPTGKGRMNQSFGGDIRKIVLGRMLAQVAIVPMDVPQPSLVGYDGDEQMLAAVKGNVAGTTLTLKGEIPFKAGGAHNPFGSNVFMGGNVTITGGSFSSFSSSGGSGGTIILDGREVDLDRSIQLVLIIPKTTNIKVSGLIGAVGITDYLDAELDFSPSIRAELVASGVKSLIGDLSGSGKASLTSVTEDADLEVSGSGTFTIGEVAGNVDAKVSGSGNVTISRGTSLKFRGSVSGSGNVSHYGTVRGNARLRVSGSGNAVATRVDGEVDRSVTGSGQVTVNGTTYRPRHGW
jgi:hypothetical protein